MSDVVTDIFNNALIEAGVDETISSAEESSVSATRCRRIYDVTKRETLSSYPWSFATKLVNIAKIESTEAPVGFSYAFAYPSEALRVLNTYLSEGDYRSKNTRVRDEENTHIGVFENKKSILSDSDATMAEIIVNVDETEFSSGFTRLLYLNMAKKLAKLTGAGQETKNDILRDIALARSQALVENDGEIDTSLSYSNEYVDVRG